MNPDGHLLALLVLIVILIGVNAFFAASEIAIVTANDKRLRKKADEGNKDASLLLKMISRPSSFLASIQVGVTLSGLLASAIASESFADRVTGFFANMGLPASVVKVVAITVITLLLSYFTLVFGELVPKRIAMKNPERVALRVSGILHGVSVVFHPFVWFLAVSTNLFARPFGIKAVQEKKNITEEEILMMVDVGEENGIIEESEKEMINNILEFTDKAADEIMTHRTEISAVEVSATLEEVLEIAVHEGYSRIPVYEESLDNIVGVLFVKDLLRFVGTKFTSEFDVRRIMRSPLFIPDSKHCRELFQVFTDKKVHMAVVVDEYGGTAGIVTMEDLVESIVGNIQDEYDNEEDEFSVVNDTTFTIEGTADLDEVSRLLDVELPEGDYDTIGGLIVDRLGRIPEENEHPSVTVAGVTFTIEQMEDRHIDKLRAVKAPSKPVTEKENKSKE